SGLTIGDYFLWNWSLNGSHDVLALVSGLTLPPLAAAFVWLVALTAARLLGRMARRSPARETPKTASAPARIPHQTRAIARSRRALRGATAAARTQTPATRTAPTMASSPTSFAVSPAPTSATAARRRATEPRRGSNPGSSSKLAA